MSKIAGWEANSIDTDRILHIFASDLDLSCLLACSVPVLRNVMVLQHYRDHSLAVVLASASTQ